MALLMKKNIHSNESQSQESSSKTLIARYARGNVALQRGRYVTAEEKKERKERVLGLRFI